MANETRVSDAVHTLHAGLHSLHRTLILAGTRLNEEKTVEQERSPCLDARHSSGVKMWSTRRLIALDALMACWGLGTWLGVNGLYLQLPLLVERLPEGWGLPASMALSVQTANIGMLFYGVLRRLRPRASDAPYIYSLLTLGSLALILNSFLYDLTATIFSSERSVAFLFFTFLAALVGCTSSVLFYPYLRHFRDVYLSTYLVGEGLSGFLPSILALIQGVGGEPECMPSADNSTLQAVYPPPRFDTTTFLSILSALCVCSLFSFLALNNCEAFRSERVKPSAVVKNEEAMVRDNTSVSRWVMVMVMMGLLNALMNGVLPSMQSYSCMPYGARAYHLAITLCAMANPSACLAGVWLRPVTSRVLATIMAVAALPLAFILTTAFLSPTPPMKQFIVGKVLVVAAWVSVTGVVSYGRMWVFAWARRGGERGMRTCGGATQAGSAVGSLLMFALVNYTPLFVQPPLCPSLRI